MVASPAAAAPANSETAAWGGAIGDRPLSVRIDARSAAPEATPAPALDAWLEPRVAASLTGPNALGALRLVAFADRARLTVSRDALSALSAAEGGRRLSFEYMLAAPRSRLTLRAGYRYGLPFDEVERTDDAVLLAAGGSLALSAGTVAWLQLDFAGFRELAGARLLRLDAVPGLRIRPFAGPLEIGAGVLLSLESRGDSPTFAQRLTRVIQVSTTF